MFKRIAFTIISVISLGFYPGSICSDQLYISVDGIDYIVQEAILPKNTVIVWDLDGPLLTWGIKLFKKTKSVSKDIIMILRDLGYRIDLGTNNKRKQVRAYQKKFVALFKVFTNIKCIESKHDPKKPSDEYFKDYMKRFGTDKTKKFYIFIDDKIENVQAAIRNGFIGIHFKNPEQLFYELQLLGIL